MWQSVAKTLKRWFIESDPMPPPLFQIGEMVQERERPNIAGVVNRVVWHHKRDEYLYFLTVNGKKKSRSYFANELIRFLRKTT
jgi:hypothetical protein